MKNQTRTKDMTQGNPTRLLLFFSIPVLLGNLFQQFYSLVDTIIVGRCIGPLALAAVGATGAVNFLVLGFVNGMTSGFAVTIAQRFGAKDENGLRAALGSAIQLCIAVTVVVTVLAVTTTRPLLVLMNTPEDIIADSAAYIRIIYAGIITMVLYNMVSCVLRALGDSRTPLYFLIISSFLNIGLDLILILGFNLGIPGAAYATVISQGVSGVACFIYTAVKYPILHLHRTDFVVRMELIRRHLFIGFPMALQFSITAIGCVILQSALNVFGSTTIAAYTAASKVEALVTTPAGTFGVTMANYAGQNLGASRLDRISTGVRRCAVLTVAFSLISILLVFTLGEPMIRLFMEEENLEILQLAQQYLRVTCFFYPPLFLIFVYRNVLQGIGHSLMPLMTGGLELVARAAVAFTLPGVLGYLGIILAGPVAWVSAMLLLLVSYLIIFRRVKNKWVEMNPPAVAGE